MEYLTSQADNPRHALDTATGLLDAFEILAPPEWSRVSRVSAPTGTRPDLVQ
jgi:hypothetical protein